MPLPGTFCEHSVGKNAKYDAFYLFSTKTSVLSLAVQKIDKYNNAFVFFVAIENEIIFLL